MFWMCKATCVPIHNAGKLCDSCWHSVQHKVLLPPAADEWLQGGCAKQWKSLTFVVDTQLTKLSKRLKLAAKPSVLCELVWFVQEDW